MTEAWRHSDDAKSFVQDLAEQGYILARGKRPYVLVDAYGGMHALSKLIVDKDVKTKEVRAFLEKDFPEDVLPTVKEAEELIAKHRQFVERSRDEDRMAAKLAALKYALGLRRLAVQQETQALRSRHQTEREGLSRLSVTSGMRSGARMSRRWRTSGPSATRCGPPALPRSWRRSPACPRSGGPYIGIRTASAPRRSAKNARSFRSDRLSKSAPSMNFIVCRPQQWTARLATF